MCKKPEAGKRMASLRKSKGQCSWAKRGTSKLVQLRPGGADAPWRPRWNFALRVLGSHGWVQKLGRNWGPERHCSLLLSVSSLPPTAPLAFQSPSSLRPWRPRCSPPAHRGSGFRPPRAPSAAPLHRRRRHLGTPHDDYFYLHSKNLLLVSVLFLSFVLWSLLPFLLFEGYYSTYHIFMIIR